MIIYFVTAGVATLNLLCGNICDIVIYIYVYTGNLIHPRFI